MATIPLSVVFLAALAPQDAAPAGDGPGIRVLRDPWGVPHVLADTDAGALYGYGWALAEDRLEAVLSALWTARGRRTEIDGPRALPLDRAHRLLRMVADVQRSWDRRSPELRELAGAFAAGINAFMEAHPERVPDWAEPVQPAWPVGLGRLIQLLPQVRAANREARGLAPPLSTVSLGPGGEHYLGSNAWAVSPRRVSEARAVLLGDPHLPWKHELRLYEVHLRGPSLEVAGAAFTGVPLPVFGRNAHLAWSWTWNGPDHADVYRLELAPDDPDRYLLDGEAVAFEEEEHVFAMPDGQLRRETLRWSVHGPVTHLDPRRGFAVAYRLTGLGLVGAAEQLLAMARARGLPQLNEAMARLQVPHFSLVAADRAGHIEFTWNARVPRRPPGVDPARPIDGSSRDTLWPLREVIPAADLPRVADPEVGFVQNCNNHPHRTTATGADPPPESWPPGVVTHGRADTLRARYLRDRLSAAETFGLGELRALATDRRMIPYPELGRQLERAWRLAGGVHPERDGLARDVERLLAWDGMPRPLDAVPTLFVAWAWQIAGERPFLPLALVHRPLSAIDDAEATRMLDALVAARRRLRALVGLPRVPWGAVHAVRKAGRSFPVASGMYPAISLMNASFDLDLEHGRLPTCRFGSAYTAFHVLGEDGIRTWSVLPLGQTDDRDRPWCFAMTELYARGELKPLPWTDAELAEVETRETVLEGR